MLLESYSITEEMASETMDRVLSWTYWIVGLVIVGTICYTMYTQFNKQVAAVLVFLLSMVAMYYYYVKWFIVGDSYKESSTVCPDFMSVLKTYNETNKQFVCYDSGNFYKKGTTYATKQEAETAFANANTSSVTAGGYVNGFVITPPLDDASKISNFCTNMKTNGISWISGCKSA